LKTECIPSTTTHPCELRRRQTSSTGERQSRSCLLELPPLLHGQAAHPRFRWPGAAVQEPPAGPTRTEVMRRRVARGRRAVMEGVLVRSPTSGGDGGQDAQRQLDVHAGARSIDHAQGAMFRDPVLGFSRSREPLARACAPLDRLQPWAVRSLQKNGHHDGFRLRLAFPPLPVPSPVEKGIGWAIREFGIEPSPLQPREGVPARIGIFMLCLLGITAASRT